MNQSIVEGIKARLGRYGRKWVEELPSVIWAIRTTEKTSHGKTPYSLVFGSEAVIPAEIGVNTRRVRSIDQDDNDPQVLLNLNLLKEACDEAAIKEARYKKKLEAFYNKRVRKERSSPETWFSEITRPVSSQTRGSWEPSGKVPTSSENPTGVDLTSSMTYKERRFEELESDVTRTREKTMKKTELERERYEENKKRE
ncbi:uncharacterized protein LOC143573085 [Bidens hawaiensis]|uniref:uncharacterized protein LOC143573085 n=1 Tax=Bidens hawaiensis TaxID=980011 RepID=UPI00404AE97C